ncbi:MAG: L,D-transpeptidase [Desulfomonile tiedjei]|uniref:L,D-transpeptidase n=1 Tax=Desulfomonile tiedjei TaxID=2358 RepID=A0A9D6Z7F8_9BACT|nr:L,D-transpeptidase [Desulfomonile tiedjei]
MRILTAREVLPQSRVVFWLVLIVVMTAIPAHAQQITAGKNGYRIVVQKTDQVLDLYRGDQLLKRYKVCLGMNPFGPKKVTGDSKTPEGDYFICYKTESSKFCRFLGISYPGSEDAMHAFEAGTISLDKRNHIMGSERNGATPPWNTMLGGWVGIHGYPTDKYEKRWAVLLYPKPHNWTDGCIAMWDFEIQELFRLVDVGTPVYIRP